MDHQRDGLCAANRRRLVVEQSLDHGHERAGSVRRKKLSDQRDYRNEPVLSAAQTLSATRRFHCRLAAVHPIHAKASYKFRAIKATRKTKIANAILLPMVCALKNSRHWSH